MQQQDDERQRPNGSQQGPDNSPESPDAAHDDAQPDGESPQGQRPTPKDLLPEDDDSLYTQPAHSQSRQRGQQTRRSSEAQQQDQPEPPQPPDQPDDPAQPSTGHGPEPAQTPAAAQPQPQPRQVLQQDLRHSGQAMQENLPDPAAVFDPNHRPPPPEPPAQKNRKPMLFIIAAATALMVIVIIAVIARAGDENGGTAAGNENPPLAVDQMDQVISAINDLNRNVSSLTGRVDSLESQAPEPEPGQTPTTGEDPPSSQDAEPQPTRISTGQETATPEPTPATPEPQPTAPPTPAPTPEPAPLEKPFCTRTPAVQNAILEELNMSSCAAVTNDELFRIITLPPMNWNTPPLPGDFVGLDSLTSITFHDPRLPAGAETLPAHTFSGLSGVQDATLTVQGLESRALYGMEKLVNLTINMPADGQLHPGSLQGLHSLEELTINVSRPTTDINEREFFPTFDRMPTLRSLTINTTGWAPRFRASQFVNLHKLQFLTVNGEIPQDNAQKTYWLPGGLFNPTPLMDSIEMTVNGPDVLLKGPPTLVESLEHLRKISFRSTPPVDDPTLEPQILYLNLKSPLLQDITNGRTEPDGYQVAIPGSN